VKLLRTNRFITVFIILLILIQCRDDKLSPDAKGTIEGKVLDNKDLSPIENAEVSTSPATHTVLTDSNGTFTMEVKVGEYNVIAKERDYFSSSTSVKININETTHVIIKLDERITEVELPAFTDHYYPKDQQQNVPVNDTIRWQLKNKGKELDDTVKFNLKLYEAGKPASLHKENLTDTFATVKGLKFNTTYLWQVSAENKAGKTYSEVRSFTTRVFPDDFVLYAKRVDDVSQIFVTDTIGKSNIQLTHNNYHSWRPISNQQKTKIAFLSTRDINPQLYTMNIDGSDTKKITNIPTGGYYNKGVGFSWLPNGEQLVFSAYNKLYTINYDGTGLKLLTSISEEKHFREVDWCPVNDKIVALTLGVNRYDAEILLMDSDGSNKEVIVGDKKGALENPVFSIDGKKILYTYDVSGFQSNQGRQLDARIFQYNIQTSKKEDLSAFKPNGTNDLAPRYTRDGAKILFINTANWIGARKDLYIMPTDSITSHHRQKLIEDVEMVDWSRK